jgi:hypothetical protein
MKVLVLALEVDAVAGPIGKGVCTETVDEAVDKVTVVDPAIGGGKAQYERVGSCPWAIESLLLKQFQKNECTPIGKSDVTGALRYHSRAITVNAKLKKGTSVVGLKQEKQDDEKDVFHRKLSLIIR